MSIYSSSQNHSANSWPGVFTAAWDYVNMATAGTFILRNVLILQKNIIKL